MNVELSENAKTGERKITVGFTELNKEQINRMIIALMNALIWLELGTLQKQEKPKCR